MTELQRYLAEEIAEDHADGLVSRREALRRLALLGLSSATAGSMLATIVADEARASMRAATGQSAASGPRAADTAHAARPTSEITFRGPGGRKLMGAWASAARPRLGPRQAPGPPAAHHVPVFRPHSAAGREPPR